MITLLTLIFACGHGCGAPTYVTLPTQYKSVQECRKTGSVWLSPNSNPTNAIATFKCGNIVMKWSPGLVH
jgi:hypothetical protein